MNLNDIGKNSKIYSSDKKWLLGLVDELNECGLYHKAIYLYQMLENALTILPRPVNRPKCKHGNDMGGACKECKRGRRC
jgi:hypothetical protein